MKFPFFLVLFLATSSSFAMGPAGVIIATYGTINHDAQPVFDIEQGLKKLVPDVVAQHKYASAAYKALRYSTYCALCIAGTTTLAGLVTLSTYIVASD